MDRKVFTEIEKAYLSVRGKESRIYSDLEVEKLPFGLPKSHVHSKEWMIRQLSLKKLKEIVKKNNCSRILDLGCGNGWMSNQLCQSGYEVVGVDMNTLELDQAKRLFEKEQLTFVYGDIFRDLDIGKFDCVVISAALQYFSDPKSLIERLFNYLNPEGIIIIMDTFFYNEKEVKEAKKRSDTYYEKMEVPEMSQFYFHHTIEVLSSFDSKLIRKNNIINKIAQKLGKTRNPFPMYIISK